MLCLWLARGHSRKEHLVPHPGMLQCGRSHHNGRQMLEGGACPKAVEWDCFQGKVLTKRGAFGGQIFPPLDQFHGGPGPSARCAHMLMCPHAHQNVGRAVSSRTTSSTAVGTVHLQINFGKTQEHITKFTGHTLPFLSESFLLRFWPHLGINKPSNNNTAMLLAIS